MPGSYNTQETSFSSAAPVSAAGVIRQERSSGSMNSPSHSHIAHSSMSMSRGFTTHRDSSTSLPVSAGHGSNHGHYSIHDNATITAPTAYVSTSNSNSADTTTSLISSIVQRIIKILPCNSGISLLVREEDTLVRSCTANLVTLSQNQLPAVAKELMAAMDTLNKQLGSAPDHKMDSNMNLVILQSQLLILRIMTACLVFHWRCCQEKSPPQAPPEGAPSDKLPLAWVDPTPLDDFLAKQILSIMTVTLRQTVALEDRQWHGLTSPPSKGRGESGLGGRSMPSERTLRDFDQTSSHGSSKGHRWEEATGSSRDEDGDSIPVASMSLVNGQSLFVLPPGCPPALAPFEVPSPGTPGLGGPERPQRFKPLEVIGAPEGQGKGDGIMNSVSSLTKAVYRYANLVIFYLSSSNWPVVHARIRNRLAYLSTTPEEMPNTADLRVIECGNLDRNRMNHIFQELNTSFLHLKKNAQNAAALVVRRMVWAFIQYQPAEFATLYSTGKRIEGNPEILFDHAFSLADSTRRKQALWPMMTSLLLLCPDLVTKAAVGDARKSGASLGKKIAFLDALRKGLRTTKLGDIAAVCCMDICKAATYTPQQESGLRLLIPDLESDLKDRIFDPQRPMLNSAKQIETSLIVEGFISFFRLDPKKTLQNLIPVCIAESSPIAFRIGFLRAVIQISSESLHIPWNPQIESVFPLISPWLRQTFKTLVHRKFRPDAHARPADNKRSIKGSGKSSRPNDDSAGRLQLIQAILALWNSNLRSASSGLSFSYPASMVSLSATGSYRDTDSLLDGAVKKDSVIAWVFMLGEASCISGQFEVHQAALEVMSRFLNTPLEVNATDPYSQFILHAQRGMTSIGARLRRRYSEILILTQAYPEHLHWVKMLRETLQYEVISAKSWGIMSPEERAETPRPSFDEYLGERTLGSVAFFLSICSADYEISSTALSCARCIVTIRDEARKRGDYAKALGDDWTRFWNSLMDPALLTKGRVARQKKIRALVRLIIQPIPASLITWKLIFERWQLMTGEVNKGPDRSDDPSEQKENEQKYTETAQQWHNYAGFLCALGGCCVKEPGDNAEMPMPLKLLEGPFSIPPNPNRLIADFIQIMVDLLVADNLWMREKVKETLGTDLHPGMNGGLFKALRVVMEDVTDGRSSHSTPHTPWTIFVEQSIAVMHQIMLRMEEASPSTADVDIGAIMSLYVGYADTLGSRDEQALRIKTSLCQLCSLLLQKKNFFAFSDHMRVRNRLFTVLVTWTSDAPSTETGRNNIPRLQRDLDTACLQLISILLKGLPLLMADDALMLDDKVEWARTRQFSLYSSYFIKVLNRTRVVTDAQKDERSRFAAGNANLVVAPGTRSREVAVKESAPLREYAITALSNLLASNIESGLQHSLALGYSDDVELRTAFMRIMTNVLDAGAAFDDLDRLKESEKQSRLVELVGDSDLALALAICEGSQTWDQELGIDRIMLSIFDSRGGIMRFVKALVEDEIEKTTTPDMVFRGNTNRVHLLSQFARTHGYEYLRSIFTPLITEVANKPRGFSFEIDPSRLSMGESAAVNQKRLEETAVMFIDAICDSAGQLPAVMRELCRHIRLVTDRKFPGSRYQGVGAFIFLRFISPVIAAPQNIDMNLNGQNKELRRGLLLVSKILQTLASNNRFAAHKETFMSGLNDFLASNVWKVSTFLDGISDARTDQCRLHAADQPLGYGIHPLGYGLDEADQRVLHKWLFDHADRIGTKLLTRGSNAVVAERNGSIGGRSSSSSSKETSEATHSIDPAVGKQLYEQFCLVLSDMGPPPTDPMTLTAPMGHHNAQKYAANFGSSQQAYLDFAKRVSGRSIRDDKYRKIFYEGPPSRAGRTVFYYNANLQAAETLDFESLMAHVMDCVSRADTSEYDIFVDMTNMKQCNLIPPQWSLYFATICPKDFAAKLRTVIMFNANTVVRLWFDYFKNFPSNAWPQSMRSFSPALNIVHVNSLTELDPYIERRNVAMQASTLAIVTAVAEQRFTQVTMVWYYRSLIPVTLKIGGDHLQITALKGQEFFRGKIAHSNDVFHLSDIDDVRQTSIRGDDNTFFLFCRGGEISFVFNSRERSAIVQALREARARVSRIRPTKSLDRTLLPSDVPGTLLNMAMLNITSGHQALRLSAYNLLCALSKSFNFGASDAHKKLLSSKGLTLPANTMSFVADLSREFAAAAPGVTLEFFVSFFEGFESATMCQKTMCLHYMSPWLANLVVFMHPEREQLSEYLKRIKEIFSKLIAITAKQPDMFAVMQRCVWSDVGKLDDLIPLFLDVFIEAANDSGLYSPRFDAVVDTMASLSSRNLRPKLLSRLCKTIVKTAGGGNAGITSLHEKPAWKDIATMIRMNMVLAFTVDHVDALRFLPELLHVILLLAGNGVEATRFAVRGTVINLIHSLCTEDSRESQRDFRDGQRKDGVEESQPDREGLQRLLERLSSDEYAACFGLPPNAEVDGSSDALRPIPDNASIAKLASLMYEIPDLAAPTVDAANACRARLMSLITSTAFQYNPIVQSRAFILLGCLAQGEIDDDLLYQILVSLRAAVGDWANCGNDAAMVSIVSCLAKVVKVLPDRSRYLAQMFWLGVVMVQFGHIPLFSAGVELLHATVITLQDRQVAEEAGTDLLTLLLDARFEVRDAACALDEHTGVDFEVNFGFSMAALLVKGLRHPSTKEGTTELLRCMLAYSATGPDGGNRSATGRVSSDQLGFFIALLPTAARPEAFGELLHLAGAPEDISQRAIEARTRGFGRDGGLFKYIEVIDNKAALLVVALVASLLQHANDESEKLLLYGFLADAGHENPAVLSILYEYLSPGMREVLSNSQSAPMLEAVQSIAQTAVFEPVFEAQAAETALRGGPGAFISETGFLCLLECGAFGNGMAGNTFTEPMRLALANLSTTFLASLVDASTS